MNKVLDSVRGASYALEAKLAIFERNDNATQSLLNKVHKGLVTSSCIPLPSSDLESNEPTCLWVEHCFFSGLGFKPLWVGQIAYCKHVYHNWCAFVHFNKSTKCIDVLCGEEMHEGWWNSLGIIKLGSGAMLEPRKQFAIKKTW